MDPLSVAASVIAVLQATNAVIQVCYDFKSALAQSPWALTKILAEVKDLRNVLQTLVTLAEDLEDARDEGGTMSKTFSLLYAPDEGPLAACLDEMKSLERKLTPKSWYDKTGLARKALIQAMGWQLKDKDVQASLQRLERCKSTLNLALSADQTYDTFV
jgi:hypothetical protein